MAEPRRPLRIVWTVLRAILLWLLSVVIVFVAFMLAGALLLTTLAPLLGGPRALWRLPLWIVVLGAVAAVRLVIPYDERTNVMRRLLTRLFPPKNGRR